MFDRMHDGGRPYYGSTWQRNILTEKDIGIEYLPFDMEKVFVSISELESGIKMKSIELQKWEPRDSSLEA